MFNLNEKYFSISERCGRNHQNKFCLRPLKERLGTWELTLCDKPVIKPVDIGFCGIRNFRLPQSSGSYAIGQSVTHLRTVS